MVRHTARGAHRAGDAAPQDHADGAGPRHVHEPHVVDRLLDPKDTGITLATLWKASKALGVRLVEVTASS